MSNTTGMRRARVAVFTAAVFLATIVSAMAESAGPTSPFAAKRNDSWILVGAGGGGAQFRPAISPHDPKKMFVACDMTCAFASDDGGDSWRSMELRDVVEFWAFDPNDPDTVYAQTMGLFRSTDGGKTWALVHPAPENVTRMASVGDHGDMRFVTKDGSRENLTALAVDPSDSKVLYAAMAGPQGSRLVVSSDWGATWKKDADLPGAPRAIYVDAASGKDARTLYVVMGNSVSVREKGKWTHHKGPEDVTTFNDVSCGWAADRAGPVFYAVSGRAWRGSEGVTGLFVSRDGGGKWERTDADFFAKSGVTGGNWRLQAVATCLTNPDVAYLSYQWSAARPSTERYLGTAKTTDGGRTWEFVWKDSDTPGENSKGAWLNERFGPGWGENPFNLAVGPKNADLCVGTDFGRTMRTTDGGKTWDAVYSRKVSGGDWSTTGIDVSCCYNVHSDPFDLDHMFVSYTDIGLMESLDGGTSWRSATQYGVPREWINATYSVVFDPAVKGLVWASMSGVHDLPRAKMWRRYTDRPIDFSGGIMVSTDGGTTWKASNDGIDRSAVTHIVLDPKSPAGNRTLWACGFGKGVFKSVDNGATWKLMNNGITEKEPFAWRLTRSEDETLYVVIFRRSEDGSIGDENDGALYKSTNGAETWEKMTLPAGVNGPADIAIDTKDSKRLCLAAWGRENEAGDIGGGIFLSSDAGKTWKAVLDKDQHIHDLTIDTRNNAYYACGHESNAWRSTDAGETWSRIKGYNFKWGRKVVPDPKNPEMIYVTTFGGGVWYGPAAGDPDAVEDIVTPAASYAR